MKTVLKIYLLVLLVFSLFFSACGGSDGQELGETYQKIINGVPDTDPDHDGVVAVVQRYKAYPELWSFCSGTVIAPGVVLTAAHCADGGPVMTYTIMFGEATQGAEERPVTHVWVHPEWDTHTISHDIALMRFSGGMPQGIEPIPHLPGDMALTPDDVGELLRFIGYGVTELGAMTNKLTTTNFISHVCEEEGSCNGDGISVAPHLICYYLDQGVGGTCNGDSGGPWTMIREGQEYVVGITSYGPRGCAYWGCGTKVDSFSDYIDAFMAADLVVGDSCSDDFDCMSGNCADGVCCDFACDGPCEACNLAGTEGICAPVNDNGVEAGCKSSGSGCNSAPHSSGSGSWPALLLLGLLSGLIIVRVRLS